MNEIKSIVEQKKVSEIVVGMPYHLKGEAGETAQQVEKFIQKLKSCTTIPVNSWDERYSSIAAERTIREMGKSPSRNKEKIDQISALIILQSYLDYLKLKKKEN